MGRVRNHLSHDPDRVITDTTMRSAGSRTASEHRRILDFLDNSTARTPYLVLDLDIVANRYRRLATTFPGAHIFYAVKANPEPSLIRTLVRLGASFDVASPAEIDACLSQGAAPESLSYGNTIKKEADIRYANRCGVRLFAFDSEAELRKIAENSPGASVFCRILAGSAGARWPLSGKFGCTPEMAVRLLVRARGWGLCPVGVSFHVGSQQVDPTRWEESMINAARIFTEVASHGINLELLNVGGGFAVRYTELVPSIEEYSVVIGRALDRYFSSAIPRLAIEPGRYIAAEAGVLRSQVVLVSHKSYDDDTRWIYLDVGRFGGLAETEGEAIQYDLITDHTEPSGPVVIAGPTCDSVDILYQRSRYRLPLALRSGDYVNILGTGAYTASYSSVGFNGFSPLATICIGAGT
jgi:ornithine decarboxylase